VSGSVLANLFSWWDKRKGIESNLVNDTSDTATIAKGLEKEPIS